MTLTVKQLHKACKANRLDRQLDTSWADEAETKFEASVRARKAKPAAKSKTPGKRVMATA